MSLKQRAVKCSGYIPPSQYVPVYSRRGKNGRWHEELSPLTPKPTLDDPYDGRNRSIHEAVKLWLESSPNSVIGPALRCRSPSSGSPPSHSPSSEKVPVIPSGLSLSPLNIDISTPNAEFYTNQDTSDTALSPIRERDQSDYAGLLIDRDSDQNACVSRSNSLLSSGLCGYQDSSRDEHATHAEVNNICKEGSAAGSKSQEQRKSPVTDVYTRNLRSISKEFDAVLATASVEKKKTGPSENSGALGVEPFALPPELVLKPPRKYEHGSRLEDGDWHSGRKKFPLLGSIDSNDDSKTLKEVAPKNSASLSVAGEIRESSDKDTAELLPTVNLSEKKNFGVCRGSSFKKLEETLTEEAQRNPEDSPRHTSAEVSRITSSDLPGIVRNGVLSVDGRYEFTSTRKPVQPPYETSASMNNNQASQRVYEASDPYSSSGKSSGASSQQQKNFKLSNDPMSTTKVSRKDRAQAKAAAWENAKNAIFLTRYKREESKIHAWEEQKLAKANEALTKLELELQKKRAKATEKIESEVAKAHKKAEEKRAIADRKRAEKAAKAAVQAQIYRVVGRSPVSCFCF